jgi:hypothetical protein
MPPEENKRTIRQNSALHKFYELLSVELNESGYDIRTTLKEDFEIPWTPALIKELLWRPLQKAMLRKRSTTRLTTKEIDKIYDVLNRHLGEKLGVYVAFPSEEELNRDR